MTRGGRATLGALLALALTSCGSNLLSTGQMRAQATRICRIATRRTDAIPTPQSPGGGVQFLSRGIAVLSREVARLRTVHAATAYGRAVNGSAAELAALRLSLKALRAGNDPVVAIKTLAQELTRLEIRTDQAWRQLGIPACASH